jgi:anti-anti-sigma factor
MATVTAARDDAVTRVEVAGEIDLSNAESVRRQIEQALKGSIGGGVLDLTAVTYLDSRGIRVLIDLSRLAEERDLRLSVFAPRESIAGGVLRLVDVPELRLEPAEESTS